MAEVDQLWLEKLQNMLNAKMPQKQPLTNIEDTPLENSPQYLADPKMNITAPPAIFYKQNAENRIAELGDLADNKMRQAEQARNAVESSKKSVADAATMPIDFDKIMAQAMALKQTIPERKENPWDSIISAFVPLAGAAIFGGDAAMAAGAKSSQEGIADYRKRKSAQQDSDLKTNSQLQLFKQLLDTEQGNKKNLLDAAKIVLGENSAQYKALEASATKANTDTSVQGMKGAQVTAEMQQKADAEAGKKERSSSSPQNKQFDQEQKLRKELGATDVAKSFEVINSNWNQIKDIEKRPTGASHMKLIFSYMKILDPGSTVREGEYATAQNAGNVSDKLTGMYNKALDQGNFLSPQQVKNFIAEARDVYNKRAKEMQTLQESYKGIATDYGLDPSRVSVRKVEEAPDKTLTREEKMRKIEMLEKMKNKRK